MFSVDNFYDFFVSEYGHKKTNNFIMTYQPYGSKDLHNLEPFGFDPNTLAADDFTSTKFKRIVMHDQEPVFLDYVDTYRKTLPTQKNVLTINNNQKRIVEVLTQKKDQNLFDFMRTLFKESSIICHSETNSKDIAILNDHGFIDCYYWWHGMIARDWFRHWEHYQDLQVANKSSGQRFLLYCRAVDGSREYRKELLNHCQQYQSMVRHNWNNDQVDSTYSAKIDINDAVNSAVHIVAETLFDTEKIYLTEKVFKPMVMSQPFILFSPPGSLQYLKDYGFKTFDNCWDESYDCETDSVKRMEKLLSLIDHIAGLSQPDFQEIYQRAMPIIEHNRKRFFSTAFQDELLLEMRTNMTQALLKQNQRHEHCLDNKSNANGHDV
jgi:hypothetical protein